MAPWLNSPFSPSFSPLASASWHPLPFLSREPPRVPAAEALYRVPIRSLCRLPLLSSLSFRPQLHLIFVFASSTPSKCTRVSTVSDTTMTMAILNIVLSGPLSSTSGDPGGMSGSSRGLTLGASCGGVCSGPLRSPPASRRPTPGGRHSSSRGSCSRAALSKAATFGSLSIGSSSLAGAKGKKSTSSSPTAAAAAACCYNSQRYQTKTLTTPVRGRGRTQVARTAASQQTTSEEDTNELSHVTFRRRGGGGFQPDEEPRRTHRRV